MLFLLTAWLYLASHILYCCLSILSEIYQKYTKLFQVLNIRVEDVVLFKQKSVPKSLELYNGSFKLHHIFKQKFNKVHKKFILRLLWCHVLSSLVHETNSRKAVCKHSLEQFKYLSTVPYQITCAARFYPLTECALWPSSWVLRCLNSCRPPSGIYRWSWAGTGREEGPLAAYLGPFQVVCWGSCGLHRQAVGPVVSPWILGWYAWVWHWRWAR